MHTTHTSRSGQAMIFVIMVVVVLAFVVIWHFDLHKTFFVKVRARDAADAGALAAARWQGETLNLIGELNAIQAALISEGLLSGEDEFPEVEALHALRARLNFVGPALGLVAANQAAKNNGIYVHPVYTSELMDHATRVVEEYPLQFDPPWVNAGSSQSAWDDYGEMLTTIASHGIAAMPDNPSMFVDYTDLNHPLLRVDFYDAVASRNWCWFYFNHMTLLTDYANWQDWPALPAIMTREPINAEYFSLRLTTVNTASTLPVLNPLSPLERVQDWASLAEQAAGDTVLEETVLVNAIWHVYNPSDWTDWTAFFGDDFPFQTPVRDAYNVLGADAAVRVRGEASRMTPGLPEGRIVRTAAAKPFGLLNDEERIDAFGMVLPGFTDTRLIPMDASTAPEGGSREGWAEHIQDHLPRYMDSGLSGLEPGCYFCNQLERWEDPAFRQSGIAWLELYSHTCVVSGGGGGGGGGARRGH
jgi:hypothetical protein